MWWTDSQVRILLRHIRHCSSHESERHTTICPKRMQASVIWQRIITFLVLTVIFTATFELLILWLHPPSSAKEYDYYVLSVTWSPGLAALLTKWLYDRNFADFGWRWTNRKWLLLSYSIPLLYSLVAALGTWLSGLGKFDDAAALQALTRPLGFNHLPFPLDVAGVVLVTATFGWLHYCLTALGEELGWRGLLVPELAKIMPFAPTALLSGGVWAVWHYPIILFSDYNGGTPPGYSIPCFTLMLVATSVPLTWLRLRSGSLWTGVIFHASHNVFILSLFNPLTQDTGITKYISGEFGVALVITTAIPACLFWQWRSHLSRPQARSQQRAPTTH